MSQFLFIILCIKHFAMLIWKSSLRMFLIIIFIITITTYKHSYWKQHVDE